MDNNHLAIKTLTWSREYHGLFDYTTHAISKSLLRCSGDSHIVLSGDTCALTASGEFQDSDLELISLRPQKDRFIIDQFGLENSDSMWLVLRYLNYKMHKLAVGDSLRLGRVHISVKHLYTEGPHPVLLSTCENINVFTGEEACRICLCDTNPEEDPLVSICKCSGSMGAIHISCLQEWLKSKISSRHSEHVFSYYWNDISCEFCKSSLPSSVILNNETIELVKIQFPESPYIVLEEFTPDETVACGVHLVAISNDASVRVGRDADSDIKLNDPSVSRQHASIKKINGEFFIVDNDSKFGTLLQLKHPVSLKMGGQITLQVSRTVLHLQFKQPWSCRLCFFGSNKMDSPEFAVITEGDDEDEE